MINCMNNTSSITPLTSASTTPYLPNDMTVTMAYVPFQLDISYYNADDAFKRGTLFAVLDKPFKGRCVVC